MYSTNKCKIMFIKRCQSNIKSPLSRVSKTPTQELSMYTLALTQTQSQIYVQKNRFMEEVT